MNSYPSAEFLGRRGASARRPHRSPFAAPRPLAALAALLATSSFLSAQPARAPGGGEAEGDTVALPTFQVSTTADQGYRAGNSVSATRIETPIKDLPFAVSAFTEQFIGDIGARDLFDIVRYAPGVTSAGREFTAGNTRFAIRGYDQLAPQRNGFVGASYVDVVNVARVEVVKGPASVLYGQIAPGGTVNYITKRPQAERFDIVRVQAGFDSFWRTELDANHPLIAGTLGARVNAAFEHGFESIGHGDVETFVFAPSLQWKPTARTTVTLEYEWFRRREDEPVFMKPNMRVTGLIDPTSRIDRGFLGYYPLPDDFNYPGRHDYRDTDLESANLEITQTIGDHWTLRGNANWNANTTANKLTGVADALLGVPAGMTAADFAAAVLADPEVGLTAPTARLTRRKRLEESYGDGTAFQLEAAGRLPVGAATLKPLLGVFTSSSDSFTRRRESGGAPPAGTPNSATTPAQHFQPWDLKDPSTWNDNADYDPATLPLTTWSKTESTDTAAYGVLTATFLDDRLNLVGGARYNKAESDGLNLRTGATESRELSETTPQFGVGYRFTPAVMAYASYSESFVVSNRFLQTLGQIDFTRPAAPNTAEGIDVGVKTDFLDGRVSASAAYFKIQQQDRVLQFSQRNAAGNTVVTTVQGTEDESDGFELETTLSPTDAWQLYASYTYTDVQVTKTVPELTPYVGTRPEATVQHLASLWTRYTLPGGVWLGGGFTYTGEKAQRVDNPGLFLPSVTLWDATVGYDWSWRDTDLSATLAWKNISDEEYFPANQQRGLPSRLILSVSAKVLVPPSAALPPAPASEWFPVATSVSEWGSGSRERQRVELGRRAERADDRKVSRPAGASRLGTPPPLAHARGYLPSTRSRP